MSAFAVELSALLQARVRRIDIPEADMVCLTLNLSPSHAQHVLLLSLRRDALGIGLIDARPAGAPANAYCGLLRKHLENAVIVRAAADAEEVQLEFRRGPDKASLRLSSLPLGLALEVAGRAFPMHGATESARGLTVRMDDSLTSLLHAGARLLEERGMGSTLARARVLVRDLLTLEKKLARRMTAVRGDLARNDEIPRLREDASLILSYLHTLAKGARELVVDYGDEETKRTIRLDPARTPQLVATSLFDRARKLERGDTIARARLAETERALAELKTVRLALQVDPLERAPTEEELSAAQAVLDDARGPQKAIQDKRQSKAVPRLPYRVHFGTAGREIRVGRSAKDNDKLTQEHAAPHDVWLHARGIKGAHVVVPLMKNETCPPELLIDAATLAAHFSDHSQERVVEIDYAPKGRVRKRRGMAVGMVEITQPKTLAVRVEAERLARLLGRDSSR